MHTDNLRKLALETNDGVLRGPALGAADEIDRLRAEIKRLTKKQDHDALTREGVLQKRINDLLGRAEKAEAERDAAREVNKGYSNLIDILQAERDEARAQVAFNPTTVLAGATETPRAWLDVMGERVRQITAEGWTTEHDDCHLMAEMAQAAACYALSGTSGDEAIYIHGRWKDYRDLIWPFARDCWKPTDRRRDLVKAGALILAEIERLDRGALAACEAARTNG